ncbi:hypothetical protein LQV05_004664 [Cryptococcus neoformans]|nr:2-dehydropantoate 2-reductase [Cryptococcus neoformans var. grubii]OXC60553.1 2-dehydropantoate 2-reductase [Cryptococcus neoformans var. grubii MW-RSA852]UOH81983.1 hypothetical protein LQV05_004664 [Cryptococcus neoformans]
MGRVHILGIGSIGTLIAHHLRLAHPSLPLTLQVRNASLFSDLSVTRDGITSRSSNYDFESPNSEGCHITSLIVALKTTQTLSAIRPLLPRLSPTSVVTLLQNGMGVYDELCEHLWPESISRPFFVLGATPHGVAPAGGKGVVGHHTPTGHGDIKWGVVPHPRGATDPLEKWLFGSNSTSIKSPLELPAVPVDNGDLTNLHFTLSALLSTTPLNPILLPYPQLRVELLLKLAVNAVVNPLTAILGRGQLRNGTLSIHSGGTALVEAVVDETSRVLVSYLQTQSLSSEKLRAFQPHVLRQHLTNIIASTVDNTSSMAVDIREKRLTEVDYINGYVVKLGKTMGLETPVNEMLYNMVKFIEST